MKLFAVILFSLLVALTPFAPLQAASACPSAKMMAGGADSCDMAGCGDSCQMPCCEARSSSPQPMPAIPAQKAGAPEQVSLLALAVVLWTLPEQPAALISSADGSPKMATGMPLYTRHCTLLL